MGGTINEIDMQTKNTAPDGSRRSRAKNGDCNGKEEE